MTDAVPSNTAPNTAGNSGGGAGGSSGGAGGVGGGAGGVGGCGCGHGGSGRGRREKKKCGTCRLFHDPQSACWEVCPQCGQRHHYKAPCSRVQDPPRFLVDENRALHERIRVLEQDNARLRSELDMQVTITNMHQQRLQQQNQGSIYSSPYSYSQPAMRPQAFNSLSVQPPAWEPPRPSGSFSGFGPSDQMAPTRSGPSQGSGTSVGGRGREGGGAEKKEAEKPKKRAEASKAKIEDLRKKQAEEKKQPGEKNEPSSTPANNCDQAASTEGKKKTRSRRRRRGQQKEKEAEEKKGEGASGNTEAMEVDEEAQALTSAGPDAGGEESNREAEESTLPFRERSLEGQVPSVAPAVAPQPQPQPQFSQQASEPADNSAPGVGDGSGEASGPS